MVEALTPPIQPMLARAVAGIDDVPPVDVAWEPKLDGYRCIIWRDGDDLTLWSRSGSRLDRFLPELPGPCKALLPGRCVIDAEVVVPGPSGGLDFETLGQRIHPAASRIAALAEATPAHLVCFDVLALGDRVLLDRPWSERHEVLAQVLGVVRAPLHRCPSSQERADARRWLAEVGGGDIDGVVAKGVDDPYQPGVRGWWKVKPRQTVDAVVGGYRLHKDGIGVGSLLLGLYDAAGVLQYVGATTTLRAADRRAVRDELAPLEVTEHTEHPWLGAARGRTPGGPSRWSGGRATGWVAVQPTLVVEVAAERLLHDRFRHNASLQRWRPDRDPASCTFAQLPTGAPVQPVWAVI